MKKFFTIILFQILLSFQILAVHPAVTRLQYEYYWVYQPIIINGEEVLSSDNASGGSQVIYQRYEAIKQVLKQYDRPFTVLDIGACNGFFSLKIAEDFDAVCVMADNTERLRDICTLNTERNKIIYLNKNFSQADIQELAKNEHFDVVLALLVLHHVDNYHVWIDTLFALGDNVIIETPAVDDTINTWQRTKDLANYLLAIPHGVKIGSFPRINSYDHMLWFCQNPQSNQRQIGRHGIQPSTFFSLNGTFPSKSYVHYLETNIQQQHGRREWVLQGVDYYLQ